MRRQSRRRPRGSGGAFWTSYADMMAGLMLVFGLVMVFSIYQFSLQGEDLTEKKALLDAQETMLNAQEIMLDEKQAELDEQAALLLAAQVLLQSQQVALDTQQTTLDEQELTLAEKNALLAAALEELAQKEFALQGAEARVGAAQLVLQAQQQQIDGLIDDLVGVRTRIIENLSEELRQARLNVTVDAQTGAIAMEGAVLFDVNRSALKASGMELLDRLIPVYVRTLLAEGNRAFVGEIIIEGHADTTGDFLPNLRLSQARAMAVAEYVLADGFGGLSPEERALLREIVTANGRSWSNPIFNPDGSVNMDASRRVEIKFRLKEAEMIDEMRAIMEGQSAPAMTPAPEPTD